MTARAYSSFTITGSMMRGRRVDAGYARAYREVSHGLS